MIRTRKRCPFCRCLFWPDPRVGDRQRACSREACQRERRRQTNRRWRERNPSFDLDRRLQALLQRVQDEKTLCSTATREPPPGRRMPMEAAVSALGLSGAVYLLFWTRLVAGYVQDEKRGQPIGIAVESGRLLHGHDQDERRRHLPVIAVESGDLVSTNAQDEMSPRSPP